METFPLAMKQRRKMISSVTTVKDEFPHINTKDLSQLANATKTMNPPISPNNPPAVALHNMQHKTEQVNTAIKHPQPNLPPRTNTLPRPMQREQELSEELTTPHRIQDPLSNLSEHSFRSIPPSKGIFYDNINDIEIRPITVPELSKLSAALEGLDQTGINDVLDACVNVNIRDLWLGDVNYIRYQIRLNSYVNSPYITNWTSFYNNKNKSSVTNSNIRVAMIKMTKQEYIEYQAQGLQIPTLRDQEEYNRIRKTIKPDMLWLYEQAQYVKGNNLEEKINNISLMKPDDLYLIKEFKEQLNTGGVIESIQVRDTNFNAEKALVYLNQSLLGLNGILDTNENLSPIYEQLAIDKRETTIKEIARIKSELDQHGEAEPMLETIPVKIGIYDFFPQI